MTQEILVYIVVAAAFLAAARWLFVSIKNARNGDIRCAGCPLSEQCKKRNECHRAEKRSGAIGMTEPCRNAEASQ